MNENLKALIEAVYEIPNEIGADNEMGSHNLNNLASQQFGKRYPYLIKHLSNLQKLAEVVEKEYNLA
jgi:hypothetical protein